MMREKKYFKRSLNSIHSKNKFARVLTLCEDRCGSGMGWDRGCDGKSKKLVWTWLVDEREGTEIMGNIIKCKSWGANN